MEVAPGAEAALRINREMRESWDCGERIRWRSSRNIAVVKARCGFLLARLCSRERE